MSKTKTKCSLFAIQNALKATLVSVPCAIKTAHKVTLTSSLSATSHRDMAEESDHTLNARTVKSGASCGTPSARKASTPSRAACVSLSAQRVCLTLDSHATRRCLTVEWDIPSHANPIKIRNCLSAIQSAPVEHGDSDQFAGDHAQQVSPNAVHSVSTREKLALNTSQEW